MNLSYTPAEKKNWTGRASNPDVGNQYWHQEVEIFDLTKGEADGVDIGIVGYVCDEGVKRNLGRVGAQEGPNSIRERLAKLPIHFDGQRVVDLGDIVCEDDKMEVCQNDFAEVISSIISKNVFPIALGGGHDMAFGHFKGILDALKTTDKKSIGIINFDAHFDLRPVEGKSNSGTPFNQIIAGQKQDSVEVNYFAVGIQRQANTKELFSIAEQEGVEYAVNYECESSNPELGILKNRLQTFIDRNDCIYVTIDMDGFSSAYAPGVSAPSPLGFTPYFVFKTLGFLIDSGKVISCDIAELNPSLDRDSLTANLAAKLVDFIVMRRKGTGY